VAARQLFLDAERIEDSRCKLGAFLQKRSHTRKEWQSLVGTLSFLSQVVVPGRAFMSRISRRLSGPWNWQHVDASARADLTSWRGFLQTGMFRTFAMFDSGLVPHRHLYTDSSGSLGYGGVMGSEWFFGSWDDPWWQQRNIMLLELYPIWLAVRVWQSRLRNSVLMVHTDNAALVPVLSRWGTKLHEANALLRDICLQCMNANIVLRVCHIPGVDNVLADSLSRLQVATFRRLAGDRVQREPAPIDRVSLRNSCKAMLTSF
jgi:hypothetical protein